MEDTQVLGSKEVVENDDPLGFARGVEFVISQGAIIALLPIEEWLTDLERCDTTGPILDPTLYRRYIFSNRDAMLKNVLSAACAFKAAIVRAQADVISGKVK